MPFELKFSTTEKSDAKSIDIKDTTGLYVSSTNPTGYGSDEPSPRVNEVTTATIAVTLPGNTAPEADIDVYPTLPNTDGTAFNILATDVDNTPANEKFDDGVYRILYSIAGTYTAEKKISEHALTGTSGTADIKVNSINYLTTFDTDLTTTADNFVTTHAAALLVSGVVVTAALGVITLTADVAGDNFTTTAAANLTGDLDGTLAQAQANRPGTSFTYSQSIYTAFLAQGICCRDGILASIVVEDDCTCKDDDTYKDYALINMYIDSINHQVCCGQLENAQNTINVLTKLCSSISCD